MRTTQASGLKRLIHLLYSQRNRRAGRWRAIGYSAAVLPFVWIVALAWLRPDFNKPEISDWKPLLALAEASSGRGELYRARHLYMQVDRVASWQQDWRGLLAAACGIYRLDGVGGPYSTAYSILLRAMIAAGDQRSRAGAAAVANAFTAIGAGKAASMVLSRIRPDWPEELQEPADIGAGGCWKPNARVEPTRRPGEAALLYAHRRSSIPVFFRLDASG